MKTLGIVLLVLACVVGCGVDPCELPCDNQSDCQAGEVCCPDDGVCKKDCVEKSFLPIGLYVFTADGLQGYFEFDGVSLNLGVYSVSQFTLYFSENINPNSAEGKITVEGPFSSVDTHMEVKEDSVDIVIGSFLESSTTYTLKIQSGIYNEAHTSQLEREYTATFYVD